MITKLARLEFELFTKPSKSDFLRVHQIQGKCIWIPIQGERSTTRAKALQTVSRFSRETRRRYAAPKSNAFTLSSNLKQVKKSAFPLIEFSTKSKEKGEAP